VLPAVEPLALPVVELLELVSRGELISLELEVDRCNELSLALRPLARRLFFIMPCLLQSHLHLSSAPIVVSDEEATFRSDDVDEETEPEVLVSAEDEVLERGIFLSLEVVESFGIVLSVDEDVLGNDLSVDDGVLGIDLSVDDGVLGIDLSVEDGGVAVVVSFVVLLLLEVLVLGFGRSSRVWASAAGAARASARIDVAASFIGASRRGSLLDDHGGDDSAEGQRTTPRWARPPRGRASPRSAGAASRAALPRSKLCLPWAYAEKLEPQPQVCLAFGFLKENPLCPNCPST